VIDCVSVELRLNSYGHGTAPGTLPPERQF
jgi:hypothetical protein